MAHVVLQKEEPELQQLLQLLQLLRSLAPALVPARTRQSTYCAGTRDGHYKPTARLAGADLVEMSETAWFDREGQGKDLGLRHAPPSLSTATRPDYYYRVGAAACPTVSLIAKIQ